MDVCVSEHYNIGLYADDVWVYLTNTSSSLVPFSFLFIILNIIIQYNNDTELQWLL